MQLVDAHVHVDGMDDPAAFAARMRKQGVGLFSNTLTPAAFDQAKLLLGDFDNVRVGVGVHPWWVDENPYQAKQQAHQAVIALQDWRYVGEVGLDAAPSHVATFDNQMTVLEMVLDACAQQGGKVISLHCVRAYDELLDMLRRTGAAESCTCVLHWFSGTHDQLLQAIETGCWFSVGCRMLSSKKGKAYVRAIPLDRLLLETDAPPLEDGISAAADLVSEVLGHKALIQTTLNGQRLLSF